MQPLADGPAALEGRPEDGLPRRVQFLRSKSLIIDNDPSAGSPTETLLRLLLPLNAQVWESSRTHGKETLPRSNPNTSLKRSIGSSDGRCVQRAGT